MIQNSKLAVSRHRDYGKPMVRIAAWSFVWGSGSIRLVFLSAIGATAIPGGFVQGVNNFTLAPKFEIGGRERQRDLKSINNCYLTSGPPIPRPMPSTMAMTSLAAPAAARSRVSTVRVPAGVLALTVSGVVGKVGNQHGGLMASRRRGGQG